MKRLYLAPVLLLAIASPAFAGPPDNYVSVGGGATVTSPSAGYGSIGAKIKLGTLSPGVSASVRPSVNIGDTTDLNLAATGDFKLGSDVTAYVGPGMTIGINSSEGVRPTANVGVTVAVAEKVGLYLENSVVFRKSSTDNRIMAGVVFGF
jgi:hypothetical protein